MQDFEFFAGLFRASVAVFMSGVWVFGCAPRMTVRSDAVAVSSSGSKPKGSSAIAVPRTIVTPEEALSLEELLERARRHLARGDATDAAREFERVAALDQEGRLAPGALLAAAVAEEAAGDRRASVSRLEELVRRFPRDPLAREALVRAVRLHGYLEQWGRAAATADLLLAEGKALRPLERIVAYGAKALDLVSRGSLEGAADYVDRGRALVLEERLDAAGRIPRDLAQLYFALGEIRRTRAQSIRFQPLPADFPGALEERCQLLLDAQSAYSDAMRAYDAHWSAMAGYRVGELYERLHEDVMEIQPPPTADTVARRQLFEAAMRLRYSTLLDKALAMMQHTRQMAAKTGEESHWVRQAERAERAIGRAQRAEQTALAKLPYSREQLERELERQAELTRRARKQQQNERGRAVDGK